MNMKNCRNNLRSRMILSSSREDLLLSLDYSWGPSNPRSPQPMIVIETILKGFSPCQSCSSSGPSFLPGCNSSEFQPKVWISIRAPHLWQAPNSDFCLPGLLSCLDAAPGISRCPQGENQPQHWPQQSLFLLLPGLGLVILHPLLDFPGPS